MTKPKKLYFAYGSNLHRDQMRLIGVANGLVSSEYTNRCPDSEPVAPYVLHDHRLAFVGAATHRWGPGGVATVIPAAGESVHGALYRISESDEQALDKLEYANRDDPAQGNYLRDESKITYQGEPVLLYVASARLGGENPPSERYLATIRRGYEQWGLPLEALANIKPLAADGGTTG
ncbi:gamma-glutamylcyclotransferase [bacterium]|nr:gamma-glutamylcyclotransferase [bacterium]